MSSVALAPDYSANDAVKDMQCIVLQFSIDEMAEDTGSTPRAIEAVRAGENAMQWWKIVRAARRNPRFRAQVMALLGSEGETDPDFVQGISLLFNSMARRGAFNQ